MDYLAVIDVLKYVVTDPVTLILSILAILTLVLLYYLIQALVFIFIMKKRVEDVADKATTAYSWFKKIKSLKDKK
jgi:hypothetical protein